MTTRRQVLAGVAAAAGAAAGVGIWQGPGRGRGRGGHRCPDLSWLRVRGLRLPVEVVDRLEVPPVPGLPPVETLGTLTATSRATLLLILAGLDAVAIVDDIEAQLRLLGLRLQR